jgi:hypothetical protein
MLRREAWGGEPDNALPDNALPDNALPDNALPDDALEIPFSGACAGY